MSKKRRAHRRVPTPEEIEAKKKLGKDASFVEVTRKAQKAAIVEAFLDTPSRPTITKIAKKARVSRDTVSAAIRDPEFHSIFRQALAQVGVTHKRVAQTYADCLDAMQPVNTREGVVEFPDFRTRLETARGLGPLMGIMPEKPKAEDPKNQHLHLHLEKMLPAATILNIDQAFRNLEARGIVEAEEVAVEEAEPELEEPVDERDAS